ncbi:uncharacterized protein LOC110870495 [Helianthus annuus]|uniref:uncharacterized protein LOC110870495 n=2 Tax=Helianthus annuus TaxID=4232 RepID=UPI0016533149|nr:uncharacterized protein LOC110870495 [Helianthus annuus]
MSHIRKGSSASSPDLRNINVTSGTPLSDISNGNIASSSGIPRNITSNSASVMIPSSSSTIPPNTVIASDEPSPLIRMSSGKRKLVRKRRNLTPIPIIDLTTDDDNEVADIIDQHLKGVSKDYLDHGDQIIMCRTCSAKLWKAEADRGEQKRNKPNYFLCCSYGKVLLPDFKQPPEILKDLYVGVSAKSKFFLKNIRRYNSMFSFTSMGGRIDKTINRGNAPYVFRLSGQNYHTIGSLLPDDGKEPKFSQLYIYDTDNEIFNRQNAVGGSNTSFTITESAFDVQIIEELTLMLDTNNALVKIYRQARNCLNENPYIDLKLCLIGKRSKDGRTYNLPEASEVAALVIGDLTQAVENRDIVVKTRSVVYTVEFQKRGLPHAHICVFMHSDSKILSVDQLDPIISAEIPDIAEDPELYKLVADYMIHGPCGPLNMNCPCMIDRKCSKKFPKKFVNETCLDKKGFPVYRRRDSGLSVVKSRVNVDNRYVVPYSKVLLKRYQAHINVEWCNQVGSIKYLFKYINKGPDRTTLRVVESGNQDEQEPVVDEIEKYYDCRYISACESVWRIFSYDIHYRYPAVIRLPFHLPGQQNVVYGADDDIDEVLNKPSVASTMFLSWMKCNEKLPEARNLTYVEFPSKYVFKLRTRSWDIRKRHPSIGRIHSVFPSAGEAYYLRILLNKVKGPKSFEDIRTVNGNLYPTFRDACYALGLLDDDNEYIEAIKEANLYGSATYLRTLFGTMLMSGLNYSDEEIKNLALLEIEKFLLRNNSSLRNYSNMPYPDDESISSSNNRLINEELSYFQNTMEDELNNMLLLLTDEQPSLLLSGGRTAHSRFSIPLNLNEDSLCRMKPGSELACLLKKTQLIIWDEAPMIHKHAFEALDRTLKDILMPDCSNSEALPFGGKVIVFGGDFRQILPVVPNGSRQDIVNASLSSSYIWNKCKLLRLTKNMRLTVGMNHGDIDKTKEFAKWLLDIGEGKLGGRNDGEALIDIPQELLITESTNPIGNLINFVYPSILESFNDPNYFQERAILAPKNDVVHEINDTLLAMFPGDHKEYLSSDSICQSENVTDHIRHNVYPPDVLNGLKVSGMPNHKLVLKVGVPIMLLRNLDQKNGLCNGTRLQVVKLGDRIIEAKVISGNNIGTRTFIPRINLSPSDKRIPFKLQRRQFPIAVCFAMTINKSQGQSLSKVGLFLKQPVFTHGQLYVAVSRVKSMDGLRMLILDVEGNVTNKTTNVVYKEIFSNL